jgi:quercetin dioxygenase-like cupin family protein
VTGTAGTHRPYAPSPRPTFDVPTLVTRQAVTRHIWGDTEAGEVMDWIYVSSQTLHVLKFGVAPGQAFRHSQEFRTVFRADELLHVLSGTMLLSNPETGEVVRLEEGGNVYFGADTWHHAFAEGTKALRVLEIFAPPPSAGTAGTYARQQPYLAQSRYTRDEILGRLDHRGGSDNAPPANSFRPILDADQQHRLEGSALVSLLISTEQITVAAVRVSPGGCSDERSHGGDAMVFVTSGRLVVRCRHLGQTYVFEVDPHDAVYLPEGATREIRNVEDGDATALLGVAPSYLPRGAIT